MPSVFMNPSNTMTRINECDQYPTKTGSIIEFFNDFPSMIVS